MIRSADIYDFDSVYLLICELEETAFDKNEFKNIFSAQLKNPAMRMLVFEQNNEVTAVLNLRMEYHLHHCAKIAEIVEFSVNEAFRSGGIGKKMFNEACKTAKDNGCVQIELSSSRKRTRAHSFYEKQGMLKTHYKLTMSLI